MEQEFVIIQYLMNVLCNLELAYGYCRLLRIRSNAVLALELVANMSLSYVLMMMGVPSAARFLLVSIPMYIVWPFVLSQGPLSWRALWITALFMCIAVSDISAAMTYFLLSGSPTYEVVTTQNAPLILITDEVLLLVTAALCMLLITLHDRLDLESYKSYMGLSAVPYALLPLWMITFSIFLFTSYQVWGYSMDGSVLPTVAVLISVAIDVATVVVFFKLSQSEAREARLQTNAAATVRQTKHIRTEILASTRRSMELRRLRHDLAKHVSGVSSEELATLEEQAARIAEQ